MNHTVSDTLKEHRDRSLEETVATISSIVEDMVVGGGEAFAGDGGSVVDRLFFLVFPPTL